MSAEHYKRSQRSPGLVVRPKPVNNDKTYMESVVELLNDVSKSGGDEKDPVQWVKFLQCNTPGQVISEQYPPPLLIAVGYPSGLQIWCISANGEAHELLYWNTRPIRDVTLLPAPSSDVKDSLATKRPIIAICDGSGSPTEQFCSVHFFSLKMNEQVHSMRCKHPIVHLLANDRIFVAATQERIVVLSTASLKEMFNITSCFPGIPNYNVNPVALHSAWLAFADARCVSVHRTRGGMVAEGSQSYTATMIYAAKTLTKGFTKLGETVASSLQTQPPSARGSSTAQGSANAAPVNTPAPPQGGWVSVIDIGVVQQSGLSHFNTEELDVDSQGLLVHFQAHDRPLTALQFDPSGTLILTADKSGQNFHLFQILPHPGGPTFAAVRHLYTLHRGDTSALVRGICFSNDSRWVCVWTQRGTTHVFPITPYGGPITVRTHTTPRVVNRLSRFQKSAGWDEPNLIKALHSLHQQRSHAGSPPEGRSSPPIGSPSSATGVIPTHGSSSWLSPLVVYPLYQIKQGPLLGPSPPSSAPKSSPPHSMRGRRSSGNKAQIPQPDQFYPVAAVFASPKAWLVGGKTVARETNKSSSSGRDLKPSIESLFAVNGQGVVTEFILEPKPAVPSSGAKVTEESPIELEVDAYAEWGLLKPVSESRAPLGSTSPLMQMRTLVAPPVVKKSKSKNNNNNNNSNSCGVESETSSGSESWLAQVEMHTHSGPHRRLWMGPQFHFKPTDAQGDDAPDRGHSLIGRSSPVSCLGSIHPVDEWGPPSMGTLEIGSWSSQGSLNYAGARDPIHEQIVERLADAINDDDSPRKRHASRLSEGTSRCNSDASLYHSPSQSTEHLAQQQESSL